MTEKMFDKSPEKYKNIAFQILKICKTLSNFDFNSIIRRKIYWVVKLFGNTVIERFSLISQTEHPN